MVPNGGRVYYSRRSQPPLLTQMVAVFYNATRNDSFVEKMLPVLEQEYQFWKEDRSVFLDSVGYEANHYAPITNQPRSVHNTPICAQIFKGHKFHGFNFCGGFCM